MEEFPGWWLSFLGKFISRGTGVERTWPAVNRLITGIVSVKRCMELLTGFVVPRYVRTHGEQLSTRRVLKLSSEDLTEAARLALVTENIVISRGRS